MDPSSMIKTVVETRSDDQGRTIRVTRKIRMKLITEKVEPEVALRRQWRKFGLAANDGPGPNISSTTIGDPVYLTLSMSTDFDKQEVAAATPAAQSKTIRCKLCDGAHFSAKCPYRNTFAGTQFKVNQSQDSGSGNAAGTADNTSTTASAAATVDSPAAPAKYVPKFRRGGEDVGSGTAAGMTNDGTDSPQTDDRDQGLAIRITNLSDVVIEADIRDLIAALKVPVARCNVAKDRMTGRCKGYAFVNFYTKEDAEIVMKRLNGLPYGNLILKVEIARPSEK